MRWARCTEEAVGDHLRNHWEITGESPSKSSSRKHQQKQMKGNTNDISKRQNSGFQYDYLCEAWLKSSLKVGIVYFFYVSVRSGFSNSQLFLFLENLFLFNYTWHSHQLLCMVCGFSPLCKFGNQDFLYEVSVFALVSAPFPFFLRISQFSGLSHSFKLGDLFYRLEVFILDLLTPP